MKLFISADIEGTCGIVHWDETEYGKNGYEYYRRQMTKEVAAACAGACGSGAEEILVKDAHDSARNLLPDELPECAKIFRGWAKHPYCMMYGLDGTFDGVFLTGYHSPAGTDSNPLSHTMDTRIQRITINGEIASEAMINSLTATYLGVPVLLLTGDKGLCDWMRTKAPGVETVATNEGVGDGALSLHPNLAVRLIREAAERAVSKASGMRLFPTPERFSIEVSYIKHFAAFGAGFYPGAVQTDAKSVAFETADWWEALRFFHFVL